MEETRFPIFICCFAASMAVYFSLSFEPSVWMTGSLFIGFGLAALLAVYFRRSMAFLILSFSMMAVGGFAWAQWRTHNVWQSYGAPSFTRGQEVSANGKVIWSEVQPRSHKLEVRVSAADGRPYVLRLYGRQSQLRAALPGCHIGFTAQIAGRGGPSIVGGFDQRRDIWFRGLRGQGFIRNVETVSCPDALSFPDRLSRWRLALAAHYRRSMSAEAGPVAAALVTGVRGAIEKPVREAFRHSGLAHMLAISGLHMALFAGSIYALLRLLAACVPRFSLYHDSRKPSAALSIMAATGYLLISGAAVATQRAYIMISIFFLAVLLGRAAMTRRNVLFAMLMVLLWQPQAIMQVGFQMSFAAVMALVAAYEVWNRRDKSHLEWDRFSPLRQIIGRGRRYIGALFMTSLIAGSVTGVIALVQFNRVGSFGLPANLLAMPVFGTLIMPMAPASLLFLPMGWDRWILYLMQVGIETVLAIGQYFTALNYAVWTPGASPAFVLPVMAGGFVLLVLYDGRLRWLALAPIGAALLFIGKAEKPDLHMFGRDLIMVRSAEHGLLELRRRGRVYERQQIELFHGQEASEIACSQSCSLTLVSGARLTYHNRPNGLSASCRASDIVIMPFYEARYPCKAHLYDKSDFATYRLRQIVFRNGEWVEQKPPSNRPWHMRFADE